MLLAEGGGVLVSGEVLGALAAIEGFDLSLEAVEGLLEFECVDECHGVREDRSGVGGWRERGCCWLLGGDGLGAVLASSAASGVVGMIGDEAGGMNGGDAWRSA